jgi:plasmid segregation protein ParM
LTTQKTTSAAKKAAATVEPGITGKIPIYACDFGYGVTKAYSGFGNPFGIRSLVGDAVSIKYKTSAAEPVRDINRLSVQTSEGGVVKQFFLGELARRQSATIYHIVDREKLEYSSTKALIESSIALMLGPEHENNDKPVDIRIVTGLPVSYYNDVQIKRLEATLIGLHEVGFDFNFDGEYEARYKYNVVGIKILPQPVGTFYNMILDDTGNFRKDQDAFVSGNIGIIDIGYGTTDLCVLRQLEYIQKSSRSIETAVSSVYDMVATKLSDHCGIDVQPYEVEGKLSEGMETGEYTIKIEGNLYDLGKYYKHALEKTFEKLLSFTKSTWKSEYQIDKYILTGGGAMLFGAMFKDSFDTSSLIVPPEAVYSNVIGYRKFGERVFKD